MEFLQYTTKTEQLRELGEASQPRAVEKIAAAEGMDRPPTSVIEIRNRPDPVAHSPPTVLQDDAVDLVSIVQFLAICVGATVVGRYVLSPRRYL